MTKAKLVKTKRKKAKRPRLWAVVSQSNATGSWNISIPFHSLRECQAWMSGVTWHEGQFHSIIEIPPEVLT